MAIGWLFLEHSHHHKLWRVIQNTGEVHMEMGHLLYSRCTKIAIQTTI